MSETEVIPEVPTGESVGAEAEDVKGIIPVNPLGTFGIKMIDRRNVGLYERTYYAEDTTVSAAGNEKTYYAGQHGPWKYSARPFPHHGEHGALIQALLIAHEWMVRDKLDGDEDLAFVVDYMIQCQTEIINTVKAMFQAGKIPKDTDHGK